jgi:hypothetical protein
MHENKTFFFMSCLIPDLYLYSIKIQTDIDQNTVINLQKITYFFEIIFEEINYFFSIYIYLDINNTKHI